MAMVIAPLLCYNYGTSCGTVIIDGGRPRCVRVVIVCFCGDAAHWRAFPVSTIRKAQIRRLMSTRRFPTNRHVLWVIALALTTAIGCAPIQQSSPFEGEPVSRPGSMEQLPLMTLILWHARDLSLTPAQIQTLDRLRGDYQRQAELQAAELQRIELELQQLFGREPLDLAQVEARMRKMEALRTDLRMGRIRTIEQGKAVLTPEQWRKLQPVLRGGL